MKKIILALAASVMATGAMAHIVSITLDDGTEKVITTSELKSIDIDGQKITATAWDGTVIEGLNNVATKSISMGDEVRVTEVIDRTIAFEYENIPLGSRDTKCINFVYPSVDPRGNAISLSGTIIIPNNIYNGEDKSDGILLYNHYTIADKTEAPSKGTFSVEAVLLGSFLKPNYILVESDFYGFGATERFPQAYLYGQTNAVATIDALKAARQLLEEMGIDAGKYLFNLGYSSGGFDSMATQKEVDNNHRGEIKFDKTFSGGGPCDLSVVYRNYVNEDAIIYLCAVPLMIVSFNESGEMGMDYKEVFQPPLADHIDDWLLSKQYDTWTINGKIGEGTLVSQMLQPEYCDLGSDKAVAMMKLFDSMSNNGNWNPDPNDNIYLIHSRDDEYVTFGAARAMVDYLEKKGFKKSIISGRTNLHTNLIVKKLGHIYTMLVYVIQVSADIKAWPLIHATPESEAAFDALVKADISVTQILDYLNEMGINANDVVAMLKNAIEASGGEVPAIDPSMIDPLLEQLGITPEELAEMCDDSGLDLKAMLKELVMWLYTHPSTQPDGNESLEHAMRRVAARETPPNIIKDYERQLMDVYRQKGLLK